MASRSCKLWPYTRFLLRNQEGYSLFLAASVAGVSLLILARVAVVAATHVFGAADGFAHAARIVHRNAPFDYAATFAGSLVIGAAAPLLLVAVEARRSAGKGATYLALMRVARQDGLPLLLLKAREEKYRLGGGSLRPGPAGAGRPRARARAIAGGATLE